MSDFSFTPPTSVVPIHGPHASAALFKGKWYNIKQLIGIAKEAKLRNSAPIKYHIEIANSFWNNIFKVEGITDRVKQLERVNEEKDAKQVSLHKDKDNEQSDK